MRKVIFKSINIESFGSIDKLDFIFNNGLNVLSGVNGSGKTTIFNALSWCLFGKLLKDISISDMVSWGSNKGIRVILHISVDNVAYCICRHFNYNGNTFGFNVKNDLLVFVVSEKFDLLTVKYKRDIQNELDRILGFDYVVFQNTVLFGQRVGKFLQLPATERKKFFEVIFGLEFLQEAQCKVKSDFDIIDKDYNSLLREVDYRKKEEEKLLNQINAAEKVYNERIALRNKQISLINIDIEKLELEQTNLKKDTINLTNELNAFGNIDVDNVRNYLQRIREDILSKSTQISEYNIKSLLNDLEALNKDIITLDIIVTSGKCVTCGNNDIDSQYIITKRNDLNSLIVKRDDLLQTYNVAKLCVDKLEDEIKELNISVITVNSELQTLYQTVKLIENIKIKIAFNNIKLSEINNNITILNHKVENLNNVQSLSVEVEILQRNLNDCRNYLNYVYLKLEELNEKHKILKWWYSVGFSNKGLKNYIINNKLSELNTLLYNYKIGFRIVLRIDTDEINPKFYVDIIKDDKTVNYEQLSGGQKQRVDIVLMLALNKLLCKNIDINLLVFDECFADLDLEGVEFVFSLLKNYSKSIYLVTHGEYLDILNANVLNVRLENGFTYIN